VTTSPAGTGDADCGSAIASKPETKYYGQSVAGGELVTTITSFIDPSSNEFRANAAAMARSFSEKIFLVVE
jgi:hypothetical protein